MSGSKPKTSNWKITGAALKDTTIVEPEPVKLRVTAAALIEQADAVDEHQPDVAAFLTRWAGRYSTRNLKLLFLQRPDATDLHTYNGWIMAGRQVRQGEKAIRMVAPHTSNDPEKISPSNPDGEVIRRMRVICLFDIAQTDAAGEAS
jgi:hypothetical protein